MNLTHRQYGIHYSNPPAAVHMMGDLMIPDERVLKALHNSGLATGLRDFEINVLTSLITVQYFEIKELDAELDDDSLRDALMILVEGEIEVSAVVDDEPVSLRLEIPGDLARIMSFVGGNLMNISASMKIKKDSAVLLLQRSKLETLLHSHPFIVYCVMRNLVRHVHGVARRKNAEKEEMCNYLYGMHGRY
jgi:CRP-like cAMP-binding protein